MTFLLSEDEALKNLLKGIKVNDQKSTTNGVATREVGVWFGQPDQEVRNQSYPYITIDMIDIGEDFSRAHRGIVAPEYLDTPLNFNSNVAWNDDEHGWEIDYPVPVNIDYQITTYARQPRHDREILSQLMFFKLPLRFGVLETDDNTVRRLDILDISKRDVTEAGKRLFVNAFTVRVSSEIAQSTYRKLYKVQTVIATGIDETPQGNLLTPIEPFTITEQDVAPSN